MSWSCTHAVTAPIGLLSSLVPGQRHLNQASLRHEEVQANVRNYRNWR